MRYLLVGWVVGLALRARNEGGGAVFRRKSVQQNRRLKIHEERDVLVFGRRRPVVAGIVVPVGIVDVGLLAGTSCYREKEMINHE